jgi:hypothetical protein
MKVTYHAAERFLQRVFQWSRYTKKQVELAKKLIAKDIKHLKTHRTHFILPSFPDFVGVSVEGTVVTIIPK